jgi:hypothetical protein
VKPVSDAPRPHNGERSDILAIMPAEDPNDHYLNHVIEGIKTLVRLEPSIPTVWSQHKIEHRYRLYSQRIQYCEIFERPGALDPRIVAWAKDVAGKCCIQWGLIAKKERKAAQLKAIRAELGIVEPAKKSRKRRKRYVMPADLRVLRQKINREASGRLKADPERYHRLCEHSRERWAALKADPERYHRLCERNRETWAALKADPERYHRLCERKREAWARLKADPERYERLCKRHRGRRRKPSRFPPEQKKEITN